MPRRRPDQDDVTDSPFATAEGLSSVSGGERDEFLAAVAAFDPVPGEKAPAGDAPPVARPRRTRQLARGALRPAATLDLHGLTRDEAVARARTFLAGAVRQGWPLVVIVTGKGLHSQEGPVLRRAVETLLGNSRDLVLEWAAAPRHLGGAGALAVFLRV
ncbi:MAG: DNA mismatch repair protein MutS [Deltaproteobacteria bacterium]|nr:MAG: DNA mismatch repair protein MutS [Deltaproteobacteria bacterium]